jgi:hypothetical protein
MISVFRTACNKIGSEETNSFTIIVELDAACKHLCVFFSETSSGAMVALGSAFAQGGQ